MTLIVALRYADGIIMSSDSQATMATSGQQTRAEVDKLFVLGELGWGASGSTDIIQRAQGELDREQNAVRGAFKNRGREQGAQKVHELVNPLQHQAVKEFVRLTPNDRPSVFTALIAGYAKDGPFVLEILPNGQRQFPRLPTAIGSGDIFAAHAVASVAHYDVMKLPAAAAWALAYRVVDDAIRTAAYGLGGKVQMLSVTADRTWCLEPGELEAVRDTVDIWKQKEIETLGSLAATATGESAPEGQDPPVEQ